MLHQRLTGTASTLDRVHYVVYRSVFHAEHDVYVVQAEIQIAYNYAIAPFCELNPQVAAVEKGII